MHNLLKTGLCFFLLILSAMVVAETSSEPVSEKKSDEAVSGEEADAKSEAKSKPKQYYIVEVILFQHLNEQGKRDEFWYHPALINDSMGFIPEPITQDQRSGPMTDDIPALAEYDMSNKRFIPLRNDIATLSASNYKLADSAAHLRYSPDFQVLAHFGWTQRALSKQEALPILIKSDEFSDRLVPSGELKLFVSRYLHMQVDLAATRCEYKENLNTDSESEALDDKALDEKLQQGTATIEKAELSDTSTEPLEASPCVNNTYLFKQSRKMRSKELHYLDNPVYGLLVYVTPFTSEG